MDLNLEQKGNINLDVDPSEDVPEGTYGIIIKAESNNEIYSKNVELNCKSDKTDIYEYESAIIECNIKNVGNVYLNGVNVCLEEDCKKTNLGITQEEKIIFNFKPKEAGAQEIAIKAKSNDVSKNSFVGITIRDKPSKSFPCALAISLIVKRSRKHCVGCWFFPSPPLMMRGTL